jgi:SAM-dependent methyltransferase
MTHAFDAAYWEDHWRTATDPHEGLTPHPYLAQEISDLTPGGAIDAGCGRGAEAIWLAGQGWQVTAADISPTALTYAAAQAEAAGLADRVEWVAADLSTWEPTSQFDLVTSSYAHPAMPQLAFYERLATWVAPGGTLLIVGHLHGDHEHRNGHGHGHHRDGDDEPPVEATVTLADVTALLPQDAWHLETAAQRERTAGGHHLHDVVVRAVRIS